jgi:uncharacterized membrane protein
MTEVNVKLDDLTRRLRALEEELEQLRREVAAGAQPGPQQAPLLSQVHGLVESGDLTAALDSIARLAGTNQLAPAVELLELARRRARDASSLPALQEVVRIAGLIAERSRSGKRYSAALKVGEAAAENIRRLAPSDLQRLEQAREEALAEGSIEGLRNVLELARRAAANSTGTGHAAALKLVYTVGQSISFLTTERAPEPQAPQLPRAKPAAPAAPPPPPPPRTPRFELPSFELSDLLGARALAIAGGVVTLLGIVFFFVLAVNRGWVGPVGRVGLGAGASLCVFLAGIELRRRYSETHSSLAAVGAGIAGGYATLLAAASLYHLLPNAAALVVACAIAALGVWTSIAWRAQLVAALGLLGALLAPLAIAAQDGLSPLGTAFAAFVLAATVVVALRQRWFVLLVAAVAASAPQIIALVLQPQYHDHNAGRIVLLTAVFSLLYVAAGIAHQLLLRTGGIDRLTTSLVFGGGLLAAGSMVRLFDTPEQRGFALLAVAFVYALLACVFFVRRDPRDLSALLAAAAFIVGAFAVADLLSGKPLAYTWAAEAAVLAWLGRRTRELRFQVWSLGYLVLALVHVLAFDAPPTRLFVAHAHPAAGAPAVVAFAAAAAVVGRCAGPWPEQVPGRGLLARFLAAFARSQRLLRETSLWLAAVLATFAVSLGALAVVSSFDWGQVALAGIWSVVGFAALLAGLRLDVPQLRTGALAWLSATTAVVIIHDGEALVGSQRWWAFLIVAGALFAGGLAYQLLEKTPSAFGLDASALLATAGVGLGAVATAGLLSGQPLAYAWAAESAALAWLAWRVQTPHLQLLSIGSLALAIIHVAAIDAPPRHLLTAVDHPAHGALTAVAAAAAAAVIALHARPWRRGLRSYGDGLAELFAPLVSGQRAVRDGSLWTGGIAATYALSLGVLASFVSFDWGHVGLTGIWSAIGLVLLLAGLRRGGQTWLAATALLVIVHGLIVLAHTQRWYSFLVLATTALASGLTDRRQPGAGLWVVLGAALASAASVALLDGKPQGAALLGLGVLYGCLAAVLFRRPRERELTTMLWAIALVLGAVAAPMLVRHLYLVLAWAAGGAALAWLSKHTGERRFLAGAASYLALALGYALIVEAPPTHLFAAHASRSGATSVLVAAAGIVAFAHVARSHVWWLAGVVAVYGISIAILELIDRTGASASTTFRSGHTAVSAFWGLLALVLLYVGLTRVRALRVAGLSLFAVSLAKLFLFDLRSLSSITRALSFLAVGGVLLLGGFFYQRLSTNREAIG